MRTEARVFTDIWADPDFRSLSAQAQRLYLFLLSQPDLTYAGTIALRERKWAAAAADLTRRDVEEALAELAGDTPRKGLRKGLAEGSGDPAANRPGFVVVDEDTEEVLVRSLMRRDGVWKQPYVLKSAHRAALLVESPTIRAALRDELARIPIDEASDLCKAIHAVFLEDMGGPAAPADLRARAEAPRRPPRKGLGKGLGKGFADPFADPSRNPRGEGGRGKVTLKDSPSVDTTALSHEPPKRRTERKPAQPARTPARRTPATVEPARRLDVQQVIRHLTASLATLGVTARITPAWYRDIQALIDQAGRTPAEITRVIDYAHRDSFWRGCVLTPRDLRRHYDRLRMQAERPANTPAGRNQAALEAAMRDALAAEGRTTPDTPAPVVIPGHVVTT